MIFGVVERAESNVISPDDLLQVENYSLTELVTEPTLRIETVPGFDYSHHGLTKRAL
jgi:hypothetical protein